MQNRTYSINSLKRNKFSLILSGGSSLGLAHIGTIKFLEKNSLVPTEIIGTSMGSVIAALYALGETSKSIEEKLRGLKTKDLFEIDYLHGKVNYDKAAAFLKKILKNKKISQTKIPLKIVATRLKDGKEKIFTKKDDLKIYDAVMASIAIPGILNIKKIKGIAYIDGCVSSNLPIEAARKNQIKLAVNVINDKVKNYYYENPKGSLIKNIATKFAIIRKELQYYSIQQTKNKIKHTDKIILIEPNLSRFNSFSLADYKKIINAGYLETKAYFDKSDQKYKRKKKEKTPLEKIINFPFKKTKKIIKNIQKLN